MDNVQTLTIEYLEQEFNQIQNNIDKIMILKLNIPQDLLHRLCEITQELDDRK